MPHRAFSLLAVALASFAFDETAALAGSGLPTVPLYEQFGDWPIACDNGRRCEARGLGPGRTEIRIRRDAGNAPAILTLAVRQTPPPTSVQIGDEQIALAAPDWTARVDEDVSKMTTTEPQQVAAFLAHAKAGKAATFPSGDTAPLDGLAAALRRMDIVQGREGTPTALIAAKGSRPIPPAPPLPPRPLWQPIAPLADGEAGPLIVAATRRAANATKSSGNCDTIEQDEAHALSTSQALVTLSCPVNAYQGEAYVFIVPRQGGAPLPFDTRLPVLDVIDEKLGDVTFDDKTGTLTNRSRGAGLANCGWSAAWVWSTRAFQLTSLTYQRACGGTSIDDWPSLFRTAPNH
jgi:hypothetical protein